MIRHLSEIVRLCGGHCLFATTLFKAAEMIRLSDARFPDLDPKADVLLEWSKMVRADYKERFDIKSVEAMGSKETEDGGAMYKLMTQMAGDVKELKDDKRNQELELARQRAMSQYQAKQIESLKAELEKERARSKAELEKERMRTKSLLQQMNKFYPSPQGGTPTSPVTKRKRHDDNVDEAAGRLDFDASFSDSLPSPTGAAVGEESIAGEADPSHQAAGESEPSQQAAVEAVEGRESTAVGETAEPVAPVVAASAGLSYGNAAFELQKVLEAMQMKC
jgi:hypothetical protein